MKIKIVTAFPEFFSGVFCSILHRAIVNSILSIDVIDIKKYSKGGRFPRIDDTPYGGGSGMILRADVLQDCIEDNIDYTEYINSSKKKIFLTSPRGINFEQNLAAEYSMLDEIVIVTNRYEGVDQRAIDYYQMQELSIGNYILIGGEVASVVIIESVARLITGTLGNEDCTKNQTFSKKEYIQHDHYTRPRLWNNLSVPDVLVQGNHREIENFRSTGGKKL